ncbi:MAG: hypothetical protein WCD86_04750 [Ktedonobacteraceae bacterium]
MNDKERDQQTGVNVSVSFHIPEGLQSHYVNNVFVQPGKREISLFFLETQIPLYAGSPTDNAEYLRKEGVRFECVGKMIVAPGLVPELIEALQVGLKNYNDAIANEGREANQ